VDEGGGNSQQAPKESSRGGLRLLELAAFFSSFDRFAVAPMLVTIAASLGTSLAGVAATASLYYLLYWGMQPVWGMLSDRLGRVRVMRLTLFGAAPLGLFAALARRRYARA
jgi:MFS family permease